jgi:hypothetical protein
MSKGARIAAVGTGLLASTLVLQGSMASATPTGGGRGHDDEVTLRFDVRFSPFDYTDLGKPGPSAADVIVFHDTLFTNGRRVGDEVGSCIVVEASGLSNCTGVVSLDGRGTLTYAFVNAPPPRKILAVTGGSGDYREALGDGVLVENGDQTGTLTLSVDRD